MRNCFVLWFFSFVAIANAQETKQLIRGTVSNGISPIEAVNITVAGTSIGATSDKNGKYEIKAEPADVLEFSYVGMDKVSVIVEDVTRILNIEMWPKVEELDEVVVTKFKRKTQRDLEIDYAVDKSIVNTSFGYISPETVAYRLLVIDGSELNPAAFDVISVILNRVPGSRLASVADRGAGIALRGNAPVVFEVDGMIFREAPVWLNIASIERIGVIFGMQASWRFGADVIFINTKNGVNGAREEGTGLPYDRARLRDNVFDDKALDADALTTANPIYLRKLHESKTISEAEQIFETNRAVYQNSPYFFIDSFNYFMVKENHEYAKNLAEEALKKVDRNAMLLKAWAYYFESHGEYESANELYKQIFILRPHYTQSYRDLALSYHISGSFEKAAGIYARYHYLRDEGFFHVSDSTAINTIIERESDNMQALEGSRVVDKNLFSERDEKYTEFDGTRLVFEWNDTEAEFDLQFVNPQKQYHKWEHTMVANHKRIIDEKMTGYACEEFLMDGSLPGKWQVNVTYRGNKRLEPTYLKVTIYYDYGRASQRKEVKVFRLSLKNFNQKLFELYNSARVATN